MLSANVVLSLTCIKGYLSVAQYSYLRLTNSDAEDNWQWLVFLPVRLRSYNCPF